MPASIDVPAAAQLLGVSRDAAYESIGRGDFPVHVLRVGRRVRVPLRPLLAALGLDKSDAATLLGLNDGAGDGAGPSVVPLPGQTRARPLDRRTGARS